MVTPVCVRTVEQHEDYWTVSSERKRGETVTKCPLCGDSFSDVEEHLKKALDRPKKTPSPDDCSPYDLSCGCKGFKALTGKCKP